MVAVIITCLLVIASMVQMTSSAGSSVDMKLLVEKKGQDGSEQATILFVGDSTVVQGDNRHGFIDILQAETVGSPLSIESAGKLDFDIDQLNEGLVDHYVRVYKPDVMVLMLFDDAISSIVEELNSRSEEYMSYDSLRSRLQPHMRKLELAIAHVRRLDPSVEIVISSPLVFHTNEDVAEIVCECFGGMLKKVSFDYRVGLIDLRFPLMKIFEHHSNFDQIRHQHKDASTPRALQGMVLPVTVRSQTQRGRYIFSESGHAVLAHTLVTYFGLEAYELAHLERTGDIGGDTQSSLESKSIRDRIITSRLDGHLKSSGVTHKHLDAWHRDSTGAILANHKQRKAAVLRMEQEHQRRIEEEIRLSNMPAPGSEEGSGTTASQKKRAKKKAKRKPKANDAHRGKERDEL